MVVQGWEGAEVTSPAGAVPPIASAPLVAVAAGGVTVGTRVIVDGMAVTIPGF